MLNLLSLRQVVTTETLTPSPFIKFKSIIFKNPNQSNTSGSIKRTGTHRQEDIRAKEKGSADLANTVQKMSSLPSRSGTGQSDTGFLPAFWNTSVRLNTIVLKIAHFTQPNVQR